MIFCTEGEPKIRQKPKHPANFSCWLFTVTIKWITVTRHYHVCTYYHLPSRSGGNNVNVKCSAGMFVNSTFDSFILGFKFKYLFFLKCYCTYVFLWWHFSWNQAESFWAYCYGLFLHNHSFLFVTYPENCGLVFDVNSEVQNFILVHYGKFESFLSEGIDFHCGNKLMRWLNFNINCCLLQLKTF